VQTAKREPADFPRRIESAYTEKQPYRHMKQTTRILHLRLKDGHARALQEQACALNFLWNYCNELSVKMWERERWPLSGYDFHPFTKGAGKAGLGLHWGTIQAVTEEYATRRKQARKIRLRWRASRGSRRSLGRIPFRGNAILYRNGLLSSAKWSCRCETATVWRTMNWVGDISEDSRGRWYINI
jgi:putative transposase